MRNDKRIEWSRQKASARNAVEAVWIARAVPDLCEEIVHSEERVTRGSSPGFGEKALLCLEEDEETLRESLILRTLNAFLRAVVHM